MDKPYGWSASSSPFTLPQAAVVDHASSPPTQSHSAMTEAFAINKGTGLIRRLSRGAHNRLRRRASTTQTNRIRDQSAGPVLVRRRSDSTGASDFGGDVSDLDLERQPEDVFEDTASTFAPGDSLNGLGITTSGRKSTGSAAEAGVAPTIDPQLEEGTWLEKVTKKKRKSLKFRLDTSAAKVCWNPTNPSKQFYIDDVREIRVGADARNSRDDIQVPEDQESRWITIVYDVPERSKGRTIKTMHVIAPTEYIAKLWTDALNVVTRERIEIMNALSPNIDKSERSMNMAWKQAMARKRSDSVQKLNFEDAKWICRKLEINCSADAVRACFNKADRDFLGELTYVQYQDFVGFFKIRRDILALYGQIQSSNEPGVIGISLETFLSFVREHQCIDVDKDRPFWESKFESYARSAQPKVVDEQKSSGISPLSMNLQAFQNYLSSSTNAPLVAVNSEATLDRPLNEYFVSSSHNTYLLGRQVAGLSSVEGYISALVKRCRCIEIDCWDGKDGRPVVNHGRTLSTEVLFEDCISVIAKYAFASSTYPLIISLEVHCSDKQQGLMVDIMKKYFGENMITAPLMTNTFQLPSPEELRNKILIKVKAAESSDEGQFGQYLDDTFNSRCQRSSSSPFVSGVSLDGSSIPPSPLQSLSTSPVDRPTNPWSTPRGSTASGTNASGSSSTDDSDALPGSARKQKKKKSKTSKVIPKLGALGVYACGIKYSDFSAQEARAYNHIYSFSESTFDKLCKDRDVKDQLEKHNVRYLMRVYPGPLRIDSSNFNPLQSWRRGVQMAALNWQTYDVNLQINEAMFAAGTDRTGYVLKPDELRHAKHLPITDTLADGQDKKDRRATKLVKFGVEVISAQRLPRPRNHNPEVGMNPYIEFEMFSAEDRARGIARGEGGTDASKGNGVYGIGSPLRKRTKIVEGNGFDPIYNETLFMTVETKYPSLIFVRWTVWNSPDGRNLSSNSTELASFTAKLSTLQQGYRHLPLFNGYGERYRDAKLFVKIRKEAPLPLHTDESAYGLIDQPSPRSEPVQNGTRSWPRRFFSRTPSDRKKKESPEYCSISRTSSMER